MPSATTTAPCAHSVLLKLWMHCVAAAAAMQMSRAACRPQVTLPVVGCGRGAAGGESGAVVSQHNRLSPTS